MAGGSPAGSIQWVVSLGFDLTGELFELSDQPQLPLTEILHTLEANRVPELADSESGVRTLPLEAADFVRRGTALIDPIRTFLRNFSKTRQETLSHKDLEAFITVVDSTWSLPLYRLTRNGASAPKRVGSGFVQAHAGLYLNASYVTLLAASEDTSRARQQAEDARNREVSIEGRDSRAVDRVAVLTIITESIETASDERDDLLGIDPRELLVDLNAVERGASGELATTVTAIGKDWEAFVAVSGHLRLISLYDFIAGIAWNRVSFPIRTRILEVARQAPIGRDRKKLIPAWEREYLKAERFANVIHDLRDLLSFGGRVVIGDRSRSEPVALGAPSSAGGRRHEFPRDGGPAARFIDPAIIESDVQPSSAHTYTLNGLDFFSGRTALYHARASHSPTALALLGTPEPGGLNGLAWGVILQTLLCFEAELFALTSYRVENRSNQFLRVRHRGVVRYSAEEERAALRTRRLTEISRIGQQAVLVLSEFYDLNHFRGDKLHEEFRLARKCSGIDNIYAALDERQKWLSAFERFEAEEEVRTADRRRNVLIVLLTLSVSIVGSYTSLQQISSISPYLKWILLASLPAILIAALIVGFSNTVLSSFSARDAGKTPR
jgi:hypothetical protein